MSFFNSVGRIAKAGSGLAAMIPGAGWPVAAGLAGISMGAGALAHRKLAGRNAAPGAAGQPDPIDEYRNRYEQALFGPQQDSGAYLERANQGAFNQFKTNFGENLAALRGQQVGMGRGMGSGFGAGDEDRLFTRMGENLNNTMMSNSLQSAQMDMGQRNRYMDALSGRIDTHDAQRLSDKAGKREMWGGLGAGLLGAAGTMAGAYLGNRRP